MIFVKLAIAHQYLIIFWSH